MRGPDGPHIRSATSSVVLNCAGVFGAARCTVVRALTLGVVRARGKDGDTDAVCDVSDRNLHAEHVDVVVAEADNGVEAVNRVEVVEVHQPSLTTFVVGRLVAGVLRLPGRGHAAEQRHSGDDTGRDESELL